MSFPRCWQTSSSIRATPTFSRPLLSSLPSFYVHNSHSPLPYLPNNQFFTVIKQLNMPSSSKRKNTPCRRQTQIRKKEMRFPRRGPWIEDSGIWTLKRHSKQWHLPQDKKKFCGLSALELEIRVWGFQLEATHPLDSTELRIVFTPCLFSFIRAYLIWQSTRKAHRWTSGNNKWMDSHSISKLFPLAPTIVYTSFFDQPSE